MTDNALSPATIEKRRDLHTFIERVLILEPAVQGVVGIGSIANGLARADSDIDLVIFFEPFDAYIVPAEFVWRPSGGTFHSIFDDEPGLHACPQFDCYRIDLGQWAAPAFVWPEGRKSELSEGWVAYDRDGRVGELIAARTTYDNATRIERLDEAITWLDQHLGGDRPQSRWESLKPIQAHDRLEAAYVYLVQALFAYNRRWQPWRNREMIYLLDLPWLPDAFEARLMDAANAPSQDHAGYDTRAVALQGLFADLCARLIEDGDYGGDIIGEAFIRGAEEPGRAWNMAEWNARHGSCC